MGIEEIASARQSPWQNPFLERVIGSIRRDAPEHRELEHGGGPAIATPVLGAARERMLAASRTDTAYPRRGVVG